MSLPDPAWIDAALTTARPQAVAALLRYFRDLDTAEEAFQDACLRALKNWPVNGPPRDPTAWLIMVGRNAALDGKRKISKLTAMPENEEAISDLEDQQESLVERLDDSQYRDDVLRLMFICCHPDLPATQQVAMALRIVSGLTVKQIARVFLVSEAAMEQRITRAKRAVAEAGVAFETPGAPERAERFAAVMAMVYLVFNEGYSAGPKDADRGQLAEEGIRLGRLILRMFPAEPEAMGLLALMLIQHSRAAARFNADGDLVLLEDQDRRLWSLAMINEGLALIDKAIRHKQPSPYLLQAAIAATHARALRYDETDWAQIDALYATLEHLQPSPVVTLNRAVAVSKVKGPAEALAMIEPLEGKLSGYFHFHGARGGLLLQLGRNAEARESFDKAIALANTAAEAAHIRMHIDRLMAEGTKKAG
jgi:RNA polymerase sigma-70 factor (ECF subfamily)